MNYSGWQKPNLMKPRAYHHENKPEKANPFYCVRHVCLTIRGGLCTRAVYPLGEGI